jgi:hypothetical protein
VLFVAAAVTAVAVTLRYRRFQLLASLAGGAGPAVPGGHAPDAVAQRASPTHLLVFVGSLFFLEIAGTSIHFGLSRPRPYGVPIIGSWGGYSGVSPAVAVLTIFLMGAVYCLAVPGRTRSYRLAPRRSLPPVRGPRVSH